MPNEHKAARGGLLRALAASLALHALLLSLQFGTQGTGWPWLGWDERRASVPSLRATLLAPAQEPIAATEAGNAVEPAVPASVEPVAPRSAAEAGATASIRETKPVLPDIKPPVAATTAEKPQAVPTERGAAILSTDQESTWQAPVAKAFPEAREEPAAADRAREAEALEQLRLEAERLARAIQAKADQEARETTERKRAEEQARLEAEKLALAAEQAKAARAAQEARETMERRRAEEQARLEAEKVAQAERAKEAKAAQEARETMERKRAEEQARLEAEKLAQAALAQAERAKAEQAKAEQAAQEAIERKRAAELARAGQDRSAGSGQSGQDGAGRQQAGGAVGAGRTPDQAGGGQPGASPGASADGGGQRRGSLLGADPNNIQLAYYGEGWRQKVERIGGLNFPRLSKDRYYDTLVVTVSINSDGTLAGVHIVKGSGHKELDDAVRRIVEMSAPFAAFPPALRRNYDIVDITRTWSFGERPRISSQ